MSWMVSSVCATDDRTRVSKCITVSCIWTWPQLHRESQLWSFFAMFSRWHDSFKIMNDYVVVYRMGGEKSRNLFLKKLTIGRSCRLFILNSVHDDGFVWQQWSLSWDVFLGISYSTPCARTRTLSRTHIIAQRKCRTHPRTDISSHGSTSQTAFTLEIPWSWLRVQNKINSPNWPQFISFIC